MASGSLVGRSGSDIAQQYNQALQTATHTLNYERSSRSVDAVVTKEEIRKLKCQILLLQDDNEALGSQLAAEEENADNLQLRLEDAESRTAELDGANVQLTNHLRSRIREVETAKVRYPSGLPGLLLT
jgi:chromosome segregation ATPase